MIFAITNRQPTNPKEEGELRKKVAKPLTGAKSPEEPYSLAEVMPRFWPKVLPLVLALAESDGPGSKGLLIIIPHRTESSEIYLLVNGGFYSEFSEREVTVSKAQRLLRLRNETQLRRAILATILKLVIQRYKKLPERFDKKSPEAGEYERLIELASELIIIELAKYR